MPFFFIPLSGLALSSVEESEMVSASGLMNFLRTVSGAFATSAVNAAWEDRTTINHVELVGLADSDSSVRAMLENSGMTADAVLQSIDGMIPSQSIMLATNNIVTALGITFVVAAMAIWLAPKPTRQVILTAGVH